MPGCHNKPTKVFLSSFRVSGQAAFLHTHQHHKQQQQLQVRRRYARVHVTSRRTHLAAAAQDYSICIT